VPFAGVPGDVAPGYLPPVLLLFFTRALDEGETKLPVVKIDDPTGNAGIRCPKCAWTPRASDRWECSCGFVWNTFDTRGVCPACQHAWEDTQCPACQRWSPHADWYVRR
jgi:hypothetical protein